MLVCEEAWEVITVSARLEVTGAAQRLLAATATLVGVDIGVAGKDRVAVLGTGRYRNNVGTIRPYGSYFHHTLETGREFYVFEPRGPGRCRDCEAYRVCPYTLVLAMPVRDGAEVIGVAGILTYDLQSRELVLARRDAWVAYLRALTNWLSEDIRARALFSEAARAGQETEVVMEAVDCGLVLVGDDGVVRRLNTCASRLLGSGTEVLGKPLGQLLPGFEPCGGEVVLPRDLSPVDGRTIVLPGGTRAHVTVKQVGGTRGGRGLGAVIVLRPVRAHGASAAFPAGDDLAEIVGESASIQAVKALVRKVAPTDLPVLVTGETGTGKELVARAVHRLSGRRAGPFVAVNCAAIPAELAESELFGYGPGAFSGALKQGKPGYVELAEGGTLFLDKIGELTPALQAKLLRFLDTGEIQKVGSGRTARRAAVRVVAATNADLRGKVEAGRFRADLYHRLNLFELVLPPLRERREDIPLLARHFLRAASARFDKQVQGIADHVYEVLRRYAWPGNVRELEHVMYRAVLVAEGELITEAHLPPHLMNPPDANVNSDEEYTALVRALAAHDGTLRGRMAAASELGISLSTLYRRMRKYGLTDGERRVHR